MTPSLVAAPYDHCSAGVQSHSAAAPAPADPASLRLDFHGKANQVHLACQMVIKQGKGNRECGYDLNGWSKPQ